MARRLETFILGLTNGLTAGYLTYALATGRIVGWGWAVLIAFNCFMAVALAAKLALLSVEASRS